MLRLRAPLLVAFGSFLLFSAELMLSKRLLPLFGGSASVWTGALMFFTALLVLGYVYALWLTSRTPAFQRRVHRAVLLLSIGALPLLWLTPPYSTSLDGVVYLLLLWIGLPFAVLSTTTSLMHTWHPGYSYRLYAVSNGGSFAALAAFPFLLEPAMSMQVMRYAWVVGYLLWSGISIGVAGNALQVSRGSMAHAHYGYWILLSALPAALLAAATAYSAQVIAPMPLIWVLPLAAYLLSLVIAFAGYGNSDVVSAAVVATAGALWWLDPAQQGELFAILVALVAFLFFAALRTHARLYASRPADTSAASFYLAVSVGGFLGTACVALVCPLVFADYYELPLLCGVLVWLSISWVSCKGTAKAYLRGFASCLVCIALATYIAGGRLGVHFDSPVVKTRNFYGVTTVAFLPEARVLLHGRTLHGMQLTAPDQALLATTYYAGLSGVGRALLFEQKQRPTLSVGVVGLGVGTLAVYCNPGDSYTFYEIDPRIIAIAASDFSFLSRCPQARIVRGDARLPLARDTESHQEFDILVLDAFDGDAIPVHLLTREALAAYARHLRTDTSVIAFHISNRTLDLAPQIVRLAQDGGFPSMVIRDSGSDALSSVPTVWVLLARDASVFTDAAFAGADSYPPAPADTVWTDDYASVLSAVRWPRLPW